MNLHSAFFFAFIISPLFCCNSDETDSETTILSLVFRSESGKEHVQFIQSEAGVTWVAIGYKGRVCDSGTIDIRLEDLAIDIRKFQERKRSSAQLPGVELLVIGEDVEKSPFDHESLLHLFSSPPMRLVAESLNKSTKKADRIRFIPDVVLRLPVATTTIDSFPAQNQLPRNRLK